jgi:hypothetical protein
MLMEISNNFHKQQIWGLPLFMEEKNELFIVEAKSLHSISCQNMIYYRIACNSYLLP